MPALWEDAAQGDPEGNSLRAVLRNGAFQDPSWGGDRDQGSLVWPGGEIGMGGVLKENEQRTRGTMVA